MAQQDTAKIEELRFRVKTDPRSRHFFPLAEELRKLNRPAEAEQVLRAGLAVHTTYLSGWVSLGRLLREQNKHSEAVEPLNKALQIDPGNVVAARLLADSYLALGEKVEAIKKYKLVHALLPADQELEAIIEQLERELHPPPASAEAIFAQPAPAAIPEPPKYQQTLETPFPAEGAAPEPPPAAATVASETPFESSPATDWLDQTSPFAPAPPEPKPRTVTDEAPWTPDDSPLLAAQARYEEEAQSDAETGDAEPMSAAHTESPFENPLFDGSYSNDAFAVEQPVGMHVEPAPLAAEVPAPWEEEPQPIEAAATAPPEAAAPVSEEADVFAPADETPFAADAEEEPFASNDVAPPAEEPFPVAEEPRAEAGDFADTITMADLYARQGLIDDARHIYEHILQRDPGNAAVREKLEALPAAGEVPSVTAPFPAEEEEEAPEPEPVPWQPPAPVAAAAEAEEPEEPRRNPRIERLENWLAKVARREGSRV